MEKNPLISIVVPVYNAEDHIARTLDSLLAQNYDALEIICVDDGSSDGSLGILKGFEQKHPDRLKVFHQENQGVSVARNYGIDQAQGDIIMFADADDDLEPSTCKKVGEVFAQESPEVLTFGFKVDPLEAMPLGMDKELHPSNKTYDQFTSELLFQEKARPYVWRTAFSREFVNREHIRFEPGIKLGEDQIIYFVAYPLSKKTILASDQLYIYNMRSDSATHANANEEEGAERRLEQHMLVIEAILKEWQERGLQQLCRSELLEWSFDLVLFDIRSLDSAKQWAYFTRLMSDYESYYGELPSAVAEHAATRKCFQDIERTLAKAGKNPQTFPDQYVAIPHFVQFYLMRYGFVRCFQQILISLGILKKWK